MPLAVELFCGKFGWSQGWLARGGHAIGFDIEHLPHHGDVPAGAELVLQDVLTLHGSQFRNADLILASPPCQNYSYMAMPWKRAKAMAADIRADHTGAKREKLNALFNACFRIQREASEAAGRHIPLIVENVRGAQPWVGRSAWNFGSFHLWGDVPALMPIARTWKCAVDLNWNRKDGKPSLGFNTSTDALVHGRDVPMGDGLKVPGMNFHDHEKTGKPGRSFQSAAVEGQKVEAYSDPRRNGGKGVHLTSPRENADGLTRQQRRALRDQTSSEDGTKGFAARLGDSPNARFGSKSPARKAASARIAMIPPALSEWIAECFWPGGR
jgi:hypothetical protein